MSVLKISAVEFAVISKSAYLDGKDVQAIGWQRTDYLKNNSSGFFASAYKALKKDLLVIAYRGSNQLNDWGFSGNVGNFIGKSGSLPDSQLNMALNYYDHWKSFVGAANIAVCGHSLGGFLAASVTLRRGGFGVTFNRPHLAASASAAALRDLQATAQLVNFRGSWDPISSVNDRWGKWIDIETQAFMNILAGRHEGIFGKITASHSMNELYEAILLHRNSGLPPQAWK